MLVFMSMLMSHTSLYLFVLPFVLARANVANEDLGRLYKTLNHFLKHCFVVK